MQFWFGSFFFYPKIGILLIVKQVLHFSDTTTEITTEKIFCFNGIADGNVCCDKICGQCGGDGCNKLPGGSTKCCHGTITNSGTICQTSSDTACIMPGIFNKTDKVCSEKKFTNNFLL